LAYQYSLVLSPILILTWGKLSTFGSRCRWPPPSNPLNCCQAPAAFWLFADRNWRYHSTFYPIHPSVPEVPELFVACAFAVVGIKQISDHRSTVFFLDHRAIYHFQHVFPKQDHSVPEMYFSSSLPAEGLFHE